MRRNILSDTDGATIIEFAFIAPVLLLMILGLFDMGFNYYVQSQLQGAVQKAGRDSTIEGASSTDKEIDAKVSEAVRLIAPSAELTFARRSYAKYTDVAQPEDFTDINDDGQCNDGEPFEDANGNDRWDDDRGTEGLGGARDAVLYVVTVSYERVFAIRGLIGLSPDFTTRAITVLRNQPYGDQEVKAKVGKCL